MLPIYSLCFAIGGLFVGFAAIAGLDGADFDAEFDSDVEISEHGEASENSRNSGLRNRLLGLPLFSLKFWTFGTCFFGLTGLVLSWLNPTLPPLFVGAIALLVGAFCGSAIVLVLRSLRRQQADSLVRPHDVVGLSATVQIPFDRDSKGKVSVNVKGAVVDFVAFTDDSHGFTKGEKVFAIGMKNNRLWVVSEKSTEIELPSQKTDG